MRRQRNMPQAWWVESVLIGLIAFSIFSAPIRGRLTVEGTNYWVRWTNLPQRFRLEHSADMQQWGILFYMTGEDVTNFQFFEYPLPHGTNQAFYRIVAP